MTIRGKTCSDHYDLFNPITCAAFGLFSLMTMILTFLIRSIPRSRTTVKNT